jgi:hypothetical protein
MMLFFKPIKTDHFHEISRKNIFYRNYICDKIMLFSTQIFNKTFNIYRNIDGALLARLTSDGTLSIYAGYSWDGPSGPTIDTAAFVYGSAPHDVLYQALRENLIIMPENYAYCMEKFEMDFEFIRELSDGVMKKVNKERGMKNPRLYYTHKAVRNFGAKHAMPQELKDYKKER